MTEEENAQQLVRAEAYRKFSVVALVMLVTAGFGLYASWLYSTSSLTVAISRTHAWFQLSRSQWLAHLLVVGPFLVLLVVVIALLVRHGLPKFWESARRSAFLGMLLGACVVAIALLTSDMLNALAQQNWLFFVPVVPPLLLGYQGLVVWRQRPRSLGEFTLAVSAETLKALERDGAIERFKATHRQLLRVFGAPHSDSARQSNQSSAVQAAAIGPNGGAYGPSYFFTNFAVPALLLLAVGFGAIAMALNKQSWSTPHVELGLRWGVAGAFTYVLVEFGSRSFRSDLTVGAATWAIITLIVGPALAVILSIAWQMKTGTSGWQTCVVLFFAGLSPRRVVSIVENVALQFLKQANEVPVSRGMPLTGLRGVTSEIALRLHEENVHDVGSLAYADPIRLVQSLPYDLRQVVDWIDQAQLALALPKQFEQLQERGVTGAIDLAWRWLRASVSAKEGQEPRLEQDREVPESFKALANGNDQEARLIYDSGAQLFYEEQVCLLWVMYNCFSTTAGGLDLSVNVLTALTTGEASPGDDSTGSATRVKAAPTQVTEAAK